MTKRKNGKRTHAPRRSEMQDKGYWGSMKQGLKREKKQNKLSLSRVVSEPLENKLPLDNVGMDRDVSR